MIHNHAFIIREVQLLRIATEDIADCMVFNNDTFFYMYCTLTTAWHAQIYSDEPGLEFCMQAFGAYHCYIHVCTCIEN